MGILSTRSAKENFTRDGFTRDEIDEPPKWFFIPCYFNIIWLARMPLTCKHWTSVLTLDFCFALFSHTILLLLSMKVNQNRRSFLVFNFPICLCNYHLKGFSACSHFQSHNHTITSWPIEIAQKTAQVDKINSRNLTTPGNGSFVRTPFASHFSITFLPRYLTHSRLFLSCADLSFFPFWQIRHFSNLKNVFLYLVSN